MSPILVRPVREQLEHDRIIRLLQSKAKRRYEAGMNPGVERNAAIGTGPAALYPDLVLLSLERSRKLQAVVEVETGESVNHLEALAQWANFARIKAAFHLYVPAGMVDVARRLCEDNQIHITEIWSYHAVGDDVRFTLVHRAKESAPASRAVSRTAPAPTKSKARPAAKPAKPAAKAKPAKPAKPSKPAGRAKPSAGSKTAKKTAKPHKRK